MKYKHSEEEIYQEGKRMLSLYNPVLTQNLEYAKVFAYLSHDQDGVVYCYLVTFKRVNIGSGTEWGNWEIINYTSPE